MAATSSRVTGFSTRGGSPWAVRVASTQATTAGFMQTSPPAFSSSTRSITLLGRQGWVGGDDLADMVLELGGAQVTTGLGELGPILRVASGRAPRR